MSNKLATWGKKVRGDHIGALFIYILTISMLLVGCQTPVGTLSPSPSMPNKADISFETLCGLTYKQFAEMNETNLRRMVEEKYGLPVISRPGDDPNSIIIFTQDKGKGTTTAFLRDDHLFRIVNSTKNDLTFGMVVSSLGNPEMISLYAPRPRHPDSIVYHVGLDYPKLGFSVSHGGVANSKDLEHAGGLAIKLSEEARIDSTECYTPAKSMMEALQKMFPSSSETVTYQMSLRTFWTAFGTWVPLN